MPGACKRRPDRPLLRSRSRAPDDARIRCSTPRTRDGNFEHTVDLITTVDAAGPQLFAGVLRTSLRAVVRSLSRSRSLAKFGARKSFPTRRDARAPRKLSLTKIHQHNWIQDHEICSVIGFALSCASQKPFSWSRARRPPENKFFTTVASSLSRSLEDV